MRALAFALLAPLALAACAGAPSRDDSAMTATVEPGLQWPDAKLLAEAVARLQTDYVDEISSRALTIEALKGMLAGLDPYSAYLTPEEYAALGEYTDHLAPQGELETGDAVDATAGAASGTAGASAPPPAKPPAVASPRPRAVAPSVIAALPRPGIAHLRVGIFTVNTAAELERELVRLRALGPLRGAVLDLRGDPGGVFSAGAAVADLFVESGVLLRAEGRAADASFVREATPGDLLDGAPLLVLIDAATASAAEITAGALQDRGRALVMGERSFGKGSVQSVIPLRSGGAVKFTTARYRLPSGRAIDGVGIEPDLPLAALPKVSASHPDPALERALDAVVTTVRNR